MKIRIAKEIRTEKNGTIPMTLATLNHVPRGSTSTLINYPFLQCGQVRYQEMFLVRFFGLLLHFTLHWFHFDSVLDVLHVLTVEKFELHSAANESLQ